MSFTETAQAIQISEALQLIVCLEHLKNGKRVFSSITEVCGLDDKDRVILKDIFVYDKQKEKHVATGYIPEAIIERLRDRGVSLPEGLFGKDEEE
jgi:hypothetical protein